MQYNKVTSHKRTPNSTKYCKMYSLSKIIFSLFMLFTATAAFSPVAPATRSVSSVSTTSLNVFGKKKTAAQKAEEEARAAQFWQGEWVCKDCGYIYNKVCVMYTF